MRFKAMIGALFAVLLTLTFSGVGHAQTNRAQNGFNACTTSTVNCENVFRMGSSEFRYAQVTLTNAQVLALLTTSVEIVPAQGAGDIVEVMGGFIVFDYTGAYTETGADDNWRLYYGDSGKEPASNTIEMTGFIDATADVVIKFGPVANDQVVNGAELSTTAIVLSGVTGGTYTQLGGGNAANSIKVFVAYRVHATGL